MLLVFKKLKLITKSSLFLRPLFTNLSDEKFWVNSYYLEFNIYFLRPCWTLDLPQTKIYKPEQDLYVRNIKKSIG